jgi:hypothetical protein
MTAKSSVRIDICRSIVGTWLTDVAVCNGHDLRAVLIAVGEFGCTTTQLARGFGVGQGQEACLEYEILHDWGNVGI